MIDFGKTFYSDLVSMRPMRKKDLDGFSRITPDKDLWTWFTNDLSDVQELSQWVDNGLLDLKNRQRLVLTIIDNRSRAMVGSTSLGNISERDKRAEIGWTWICRESQGMGINDQSKYLLLKYCFEELGFERVEFKTDVLNLPARNALKRIGATEEGILRSHTLMTHNRRRDTIYYSILKPEWEGIKLKNNWSE